ncbi:MAG: putative lipid II flippase FtsW [Firmicutes bacterium]|nr:putative lipid II flippase FtsW [Bacillota bacterium]
MTPDVRRPVDRWLLLFALLLTAIGMVWVYSASGLKNRVGSAFLVQQLIAGGIGLGIMLALSQVELGVLREKPKALQMAYGLFVLLLVAVFLFPAVNGAHRWIRVFGQRFQPSEFFKPLAILITAWWMVRHQEVWGRLQDSLPKLVMLVLVLALPLGLILAEPDYGATALILLVVFALVMLGGVHKALLAGFGGFLILGGVVAVLASPYRMVRLMSFRNPEADPLGKGHQALQSLIAVGNGGLFGVGVGNSMQKLFYLPEAHNDFIFAVIAEEAGLVGTVVVLLLFVGILWRGYRIARRVQDGFLRLCAMGFMLLLVSQAFMNMSVVLSLAPNKGIPLPFISYGGTALMASMATLGLLLAISKEVGE